MSTSDQRWWVVLPLKATVAAKSRIELPPVERRDLAVAMFGDTLAAVSATSVVACVVVVCADRADLGLASGPGVVGLTEPAAGGLNAAVRAGAERAWGLDAGCRVAVLPTDLPALRSDELQRALDLAAAHRSAFVTDREGTGTTLLAAASRGDLRPQYGAGSRMRHLATGSVELSDPRIVSLRDDVDRLGDLRDLLPCVGPRTSRLLGVAEASRPGPD